MTFGAQSLHNKSDLLNYKIFSTTFVSTFVYWYLINFSLGFNWTQDLTVVDLLVLVQPNPREIQLQNIMGLNILGFKGQFNFEI